MVRPPVHNWHLPVSPSTSTFHKTVSLASRGPKTTQTACQALAALLGKARPAGIALARQALPRTILIIWQTPTLPQLQVQGGSRRRSSKTRQKAATKRLTEFVGPLQRALLRPTSHGLDDALVRATPAFKLKGFRPSGPPALPAGNSRPHTTIRGSDVAKAAASALPGQLPASLHLSAAGRAPKRHAGHQIPDQDLARKPSCTTPSRRLRNRSLVAGMPHCATPVTIPFHVMWRTTR